MNAQCTYHVIARELAAAKPKRLRFGGAGSGRSSNHNWMPGFRGDNGEAAKQHHTIPPERILV
jgi:hypothetical protein